MLNVKYSITKGVSSLIKVIQNKGWSYGIPLTGWRIPNMAEQDRLYHNKNGVKSDSRYIRNLEKVNIAGDIRSPHTIEGLVVSPGTLGNPRSISINLMNFRYLFNCGEGTQRICNERRVLPKTQDIFITRSTWENLGGFLGMCLTLQAHQIPGLRIHGPPDTEKVITESKGFSEYSRLRIKIVKQDLDEGFYEDIATRVEYISLLPSRIDDTQPESKKQKTSKADLSVAYICKPKPKARNVDMSKCIERGISAGKLVGQLKNGETITLEDGTVVTPEDVLLPPTETKPFMILECPNISYLPSLESNSQVQELQGDGNGGDTELSACVVYHLTEPEVLRHPDYIAWVRKFPETTTHIVLNHECYGRVLSYTFEQNAVLHMVHPGIFPLLATPKPLKALPLPNMMHGETGLMYTVRGRDPHTINREGCLSMNVEEVQKTFLEELETARKNVEDSTSGGQSATDSIKQFRDTIDTEVKEANKRYPEIVFLGTGSAAPSSRRNASGILLNISESCSMIMDCGEGTLGQLFRFYGDQANDVLLRLKAVFISHLHADHHMGLFGLAKQRKELLASQGLPQTPLTVIAPSHLHKWYLFAVGMFPELNNIVRIIFVNRFHKDQEEMTTNPILERLDMRSLQTVFVKHSGFPHGIILTHNSGWKLVYSGDTMPHQPFIKEGVGCDLLIHEATLEDGCEEDAMLKRHSTTSQAIQVGKDMGAAFTMLTHFSQRYSKLPNMADAYADHIGFSFDNMRVSMSELRTLPKLCDVITSLYAEEMVTMDLKKQNRTFRQREKTEDGRTDDEKPDNARKRKQKRKQQQMEENAKKAQLEGNKEMQVDEKKLEKNEVKRMRLRSSASYDESQTVQSEENKEQKVNEEVENKDKVYEQDAKNVTKWEESEGKVKEHCVDTGVS